MAMKFPVDDIGDGDGVHVDDIGDGVHIDDIVDGDGVHVDDIGDDAGDHVDDIGNDAGDQPGNCPSGTLVHRTSMTQVFCPLDIIQSNLFFSHFGPSS